MSNKCIVLFLTFDPVKDNLTICPEVDRANAKYKCICDEFWQSCSIECCHQFKFGECHLVEWHNSSFCHYEGYIAIHTLKCNSSICYGTGISKMWSLLGCLVTLPFGRYCLEILVSSMSCYMSNYSFWLSSVSGSSHSMLRCHNVCIKILA